MLWHFHVANFLLPKGTPDAIVRRLNKAMSDALDTPAVRERLSRFGISALPSERRTREIEKWARPIKDSGVSLD
jgi:tripartite-type tricarboxylate transporter receptor subunit TctC